LFGKISKKDVIDGTRNVSLSICSHNFFIYRIIQFDSSPQMFHQLSIYAYALYVFRGKKARDIIFHESQERMLGLEYWKSILGWLEVLGFRILNKRQAGKHQILNKGWVYGSRILNEVLCIMRIWVSDFERN